MKWRRVVRLLLMAGLLPQIAGCAIDTATMDLRRIERSSAPNDGLACPSETCRAKPDFESPVFPVARKALMERAMAVFKDRPRTELVRRASDPDQAIFVQRSRIFGFPDTIWVQATGEDARASVIIYSRANFGYWDLGVNRARVRSWLEKLTDTVPGGLK